MISYTPPKIVRITKGKQIRDRSVEELLGSSFKEFLDSDRYGTNVTTTPHILGFKIAFLYPWKISVK